MQKSQDTHYLKLDDTIEAALLEKRHILIGDVIDHEMTKEIVRKLWYLEIKDPGKPIFIFINSPGGSIRDGFAIWDQIEMISSPITTIVTGLAASMGAMLSLVAKKGRRLATPNAKIMIHQPLLSGHVQGQATDLAIHATELVKERTKIAQMIADASGKSLEKVMEVIDRDTWMSSEEAKEFGLIDDIVTSFDTLQ